MTLRCNCPESGTSGSCPFHDSWSVGYPHESPESPAMSTPRTTDKAAFQYRAAFIEGYEKGRAEAAAPLVEALRDLLDAWDQRHMKPEWMTAMSHSVVQARAALAAAEEEKP